MKSNRHYWIQFSYTGKHGTSHTSVGTPYANLDRAIRTAQQLNADRVYNVATKQVMWERGA